MIFREFGKLDRKLIGFALTLLVSAIFLIVEERILLSFISGDSQNLQKIGTVKQSKKDVRRRLKTEFSWLPLSSQTDVYQGDSIFTGDNSHAKILTDEGSELSISPNSLVVIEHRSNAVLLEISKGTVSGRLQKGSQLLISSEEGVTAVEGQDAVIEIKSDKDKKLTVDVIQGQVEINTNHGNKKKLQKSQRAELDQKGEVFDPSNITLTLLSPKNRAILPARLQNPQYLRWKSNYPLKEYKVEVATTPEFSGKVFTQVTPRNFLKIKDLPLDTPLYWQVSSLHEDSAEVIKSKTKAFRLSRAAPPVLDFPWHQFQAHYESPTRRAADGISVTLSWIPATPSFKWEVQIARSKAFHKGQRTFFSDKHYFSTPLLSAGKYWWRVRSADVPNTTWSRPQSFNLVHHSVEKLTPPEGLAAPQRFQLITEAQGKSHADLVRLPVEKQSTYKGNAPKFQWKKLSSASSYEFQLSQDSQFKSTLVSTKTNDTQFVWKDVFDGKFFWRVRPFGRTGRAGPFSSPKPLFVYLAPPNTLSPKSLINEVMDIRELSKALPPFLFKWTPTLYTTYYHFQVSRSPDFAEPVNRLVAEDHIEIEATSTGDYYWRVRAMNEKKEPISPFSETFTFYYNRVYSNAEKIQALKTLSPSNEASMVFIGSGRRTLRFHWTTPFSRAVYRMQVASDQDFNDVLFEKSLNSGHHTLRKEMKPGTYFWRVRGESPHYTSPWSKVAQFHIKHEVVPAPQAKNAEPIPILQPYRTPIDQPTPLKAEQKTKQDGEQLAVPLRPKSRPNRSDERSLAAQPDQPQNSVQTNVQRPDSPTKIITPKPWQSVSEDTKKSESSFKTETSKNKILPPHKIKTPQRPVAKIRKPKGQERQNTAPTKPQPRKEVERPLKRRLPKVQVKRFEPKPAPIVVREPTASLPAPQPVTKHKKIFLEPKPEFHSNRRPAHSSTARPASFLKKLPQIKWESVPNAKRYRIEIAYDKDFKRVITSDLTAEDRYQWRDVRPGRFYWRVRALDKNYHLGPFSQPAELHVEIQAIDGLSPKVVRYKEKKSPPPFVIHWKATPFAESYRIEFGLDEGLSKKKEILTKNAQEKISVSQNGTYYWRVQPLSKSGQPIGPFSTILKTVVASEERSLASTQAIKPLFPRADQALNFFANNIEAIPFKWLTGEPQGTYILQISKNRSFSEILTEKRAKQTEITIRQDLPAQSLFWRVGYQADSENITWSEVQRFHIKRIAPLGSKASSD